jgi:hypothetical protein
MKAKPYAMSASRKEAQASASMACISFICAGAEA